MVVAVVSQLGGLPTPVKSRKGVTGVSVAFDQALVPASSESLSLYHVFQGVKRKRKTVYTKALKIRSVVYETVSNSVKITLAKPSKVKIELTVNAAIEAQDGAVTDFDFSTIIKSAKKRRRRTAPDSPGFHWHPAGPLGYERSRDAPIAGPRPPIEQ